jgi:hypothetical protein
LLKNEYPSAAILLMDPSASFDMLVIDAIKDTLVAVAVKASRATSRAARRLTKSQRELKRVIESKESWKLIHRKCVIYGEPAKMHAPCSQIRNHICNWPRVPCKTPWKRLRIGNLLLTMLIFLGRRMIGQSSATSFPC